jgi:hypothetical protein
LLKKLSHGTQQFQSRYLTERIEMYVHTKPCAQMFIAVFIIIAKKWKIIQTSINWINESKYIHIMKHYSDIRRNKVLILDAT